MPPSGSGLEGAPRLFMQRAVFTLRPPPHALSAAALVLAVFVPTFVACTGQPETTIEGTVQLSVIDRPDLDESRALYMLRTRGGDDVELLFEHPRSERDAVERLASGSVLRAHGRLLPAGAAEQPIHASPSLQVSDWQLLAPPAI